MMKINQLPPSIYNRISAGEVVERPASVVKEVVENSIDAGADSISVRIEGGGISKIVVADNGCGIEKEDITTAFLPHATSKVEKISDLDSIQTLGFRGEALASISSVCQIFLSSKTLESETGYSIAVDGGNFSKVEEIARNNGTTMEISNLFFNTPVRAKFLKKPKLEEAQVTSIMQKFMLAHPEIAFEYIVDGSQIYSCPREELKDRIYAIYGREIYENLIEIDHSENDLRVKGYIVGPKVSKSNRTYQTLFVNSRYVENFMISQAVSNVFSAFLMKGKFPIYVLNIEVPHSNVDVNIHPTKKEVKFENSNQIFGMIKRVTENALAKADSLPMADIFENEDIGIYEKIQQKAFENFDDKVIFPTLAEAEGHSYQSFDNKIANQEFVIDNKNSNQDFVIEDKKAPLPDFSQITMKERELSIFEPFKFEQSVERNFNAETKQSNQEIFCQSKDENIKIIGSIFNTYIICESNDDVYFIDQHAGHERLLFDKLKETVKNSQVMQQALLLPYSFDLNHIECQIFDKSEESLKKMGFEFLQKDNTVEIYSIPAILENLNLKKFFEDVLAEEVVFDKDANNILNDRLAQYACKHAIKGGDSLSIEMLESLVLQMKNQGALLCPHGRPIVVKLTKKSFEKMFMRIV